MNIKSLTQGHMKYAQIPMKLSACIITREGKESLKD